MLGDFIILAMEEHQKIPIILGHPFLATIGGIIDVKRGKILIEIGDNKVEFDVFKMAKRTITMGHALELMQQRAVCKKLLNNNSPKIYLKYAWAMM